MPPPAKGGAGDGGGFRPGVAQGTAFGWFHLVVGICALPASVLFGLLWKAFGATAAFAASAGLAVAAAVLLIFLADPAVAGHDPIVPDWENIFLLIPRNSTGLVGNSSSSSGRQIRNTLIQ